MEKEGYIKYNGIVAPTNEALIERSKEFRNTIALRRSIRDFSNQAVPKEVIENIIMAAASAPSGAHKQPWIFCAVSNVALKSKIRAAAEAEEYENYNGRMSEEWIEDLKIFGTGPIKEFLDIAPWLIVVFKKPYDVGANNSKKKNYYVVESVGIACGFLINAIHAAGLVTLTHTPSPMNFLQTILGRPENEKPYLLLPVGYPSKDAKVPILERKNSDEVIVYFE